MRANTNKHQHPQTCVCACVRVCVCVHLPQQGLNDAVHSRPREHHVQVLWPRLVGGDVRDVHVGLLRAGQLHPGRRGRVKQPFRVGPRKTPACVLTKGGGTRGTGSRGWREGRSPLCMVRVRLPPANAQECRRPSLRVVNAPPAPIFRTSALLLNTVFLVRRGYYSAISSSR